MEKPRINIEVDADLKHDVQVEAFRQNKTLTKVVIDLLKKWLKKSQSR